MRTFKVGLGWAIRVFLNGLLAVLAMMLVNWLLSLLGLSLNTGWQVFIAASMIGLLYELKDSRPVR